MPSLAARTETIAGGVRLTVTAGRADDAKRVAPTLDSAGPRAYCCETLQRRNRSTARRGTVSRELYELQARMVRALGHPTRLRILDLVEGREVAYPELLRETGVSKANLSQHLGVLRAGHLLTERRNGREVHFRLTYPGIKVLCGAMRQILARHLDRQARVADAGRREVARAGVRRRRQQWRAG